MVLELLDGASCPSVALLFVTRESLWNKPSPKGSCYEHRRITYSMNADCKLRIFSSTPLHPSASFLKCLAPNQAHCPNCDSSISLVTAYQSSMKKYFILKVTHSKISIIFPITIIMRRLDKANFWIIKVTNKNF